MERKYEHVVRFIQETPWAVKPDMLLTIRGIVSAHLSGVEIEPIEAAKKPVAKSAGSVAVLPLWGVIVPHADLMTNMSGGVTLDSWIEDFRALVNDPSVSTIVLDINSPGGAVAMVPETAAEIRAATARKKIIAVMNPEGASAAYWLASQADEVVVPLSGMAGSVGVIAEHTDISKMEEMAGIERTYITAGDFKAEQLGPLTEEAKAAIQKNVDAAYNLFISDVAKGRGVTRSVVLENYGQGRMMTGMDALSAGMVDKIGTLDQVIARELPASSRRVRAEDETVDLAAENTSSQVTGTYFLQNFDIAAATASTTNLTFGGVVPVAPTVAEKPLISLGDTPDMSGAAIPPKSTKVVDEQWDGNMAMGKCKSSSDFRSICAWVDSNGDPEERQSYKFPHHSNPGGPAVISGVRNALARLPQANIPDGDRAGVKAHLQRHMDDWAKQNNTDEPGNSLEEGTASRGAISEQTSKEEMMGERLTLEELAARKDEIAARMKEIHEEATGRAFLQEEQAEFDRLDDEKHDVIAAIANIEERESRLADAPDTQRVSGDGARPGKRNRGGVYTNVAKNLPDNIYDLHAFRGYGTSIEEITGLYKEAAMRAIEQLPFEAEDDKKAREHAEKLVKRDSKDAAFSTRILTTGSPLYDRAFGKLMLAQPLSTQEDAAIKAAVSNTGLGSETPVPVTIDPTVILTSDGAVNPLRQLARTVTITGNKWQGISSDGVDVAYEAELTQVADQTPTFAAPIAEVAKAHAYIEFSIEVDQDWGGLRSNLGIMFQDAKDMKEANKFLFGTGTNEPQGLLNALSASASIVETDTINTFGVADLYLVRGALPPRFRSSASWLASDTIYSLVRQFDEAGGANLWAQLGADRPAVLLGKSIYEASEMSGEATTGGEDIMIYGDFGRGFIIVDRVGMNVELIPHVLGANRRPIGARALYAYFRNTSQLLTENAFRVLRVKVS